MHKHFMSLNFERLESLLNFSQPPDLIKGSLKTIPWDSEEDVITLNKQHIVNVLDKYLNGHLSAIEVTEWANLIEGREDIGLEQKNATLLKDILYKLATPEINESITHQIAMKYIESLKQNIGN